MVTKTLVTSTPIIICRLGENVAARLAELDLECNRPPWSAAQFKAEAGNAHALIFGARQGGEIVGFVVTHVVLDEAHIVNFGVSSLRRGRGVGRELLEYLLSDLHAKGVAWVTLEVRAGNTAALALYEKLGFAEVSLRPKYYADNAEDGITLKLNLAHFAASISKAGACISK